MAAAQSRSEGPGDRLMSWTPLTDETRTSRKIHRCSWCGQPIAVGEKYQYSSGVFEGAFATNRLHPECDEAAQNDYRETGEGFALYENERPITAEGKSE